MKRRRQEQSHHVTQYHTSSPLILSHLSPLSLLTIHPIVVQIDRSALGLASFFERSRHRRLPSHLPSRPLHPHSRSTSSLYQTLGVDAGFDSMTLAHRLFPQLSPRAPPKNRRARYGGQDVGAAWPPPEQAPREAGLGQVVDAGSVKRVPTEGNKAPNGKCGVCSSSMSGLQLNECPPPRISRIMQ